MLLLSSSRHQTAHGHCAFSPAFIHFTWKTIDILDTGNIKSLMVLISRFVRLQLFPFFNCSGVYRRTQVKLNKQTYILVRNHGFANQAGKSWVTTNIHVSLPARPFQVHRLCRAVWHLVSWYSIDHWCSLRKLVGGHKHCRNTHFFLHIKASKQRGKMHSKKYLVCTYKLLSFICCEWKLSWQCWHVIVVQFLCSLLPLKKLVTLVEQSRWNTELF